MSLRFFCDQCVPLEISRALRNAGHDAAVLADIFPVRSPDNEVIAKAEQLNAVLVSLNGDFSDIVAYPPSQHHGIIAIQLHNHPEIIPQLMERLIAFLAANPAQEFYCVKLFLVETHRIRIRQ